MVLLGTVWTHELTTATLPPHTWPKQFRSQIPRPAAVHDVQEKAECTGPRPDTIWNGGPVCVTTEENQPVGGQGSSTHHLDLHVIFWDWFMRLHEDTIDRRLSCCANSCQYYASTVIQIIQSDEDNIKASYQINRHDNVYHDENSHIINKTNLHHMICQHV
jgi:hypothetical protein